MGSGLCLTVLVFLLLYFRDYPGGSEVGNLPCNVGDMGLIPGQGTKIPHGHRAKLTRWAGVLRKIEGGGSQPAPEGDAVG